MISALTAFLQAKALSFLVVFCVAASEQLYFILLLVCPFGCCSVAKSCPALCNPMDGSTPGFPVLHHLQSLLKFMSIESVMLPNHLIVCHPLLLLPCIFPSIRVFSILEMRKLRFRKVDWFAQGHTATNAELYQAAGSESVLLPMLRSEGCVGFNWTEGRGRGWPTQDPFSARRTEGAQD